MKTCPYCSAENWDDAQACHYCGRPLPVQTVSQPPKAGDTAPVNVRPANPPPAYQPPHSYPPGQPYQPGSTQPGYPAQQPYADPYTRAPSNPQQGNTLPYPQQGYNPNQGYIPQGAASYPNPAYGPPPTVPPPPQYAQPAYPPAKPPASRAWPVMIAGLVLVLLCGAFLAAWTIKSAAQDRLGGLFPVQPTDALPGFNPGVETTAPVAVPTAWPTWTPEVVQAQPTADATQELLASKLLSPECSAALDNLEALSGKIKSEPTIPLNADWRESLGLAVDEMKAQCGTLDKASPVPGLVGDAQRNLGAASEAFDEADRLFKEGVDERSPAKVLDAGKTVIEAARYLGAALDALGKIGD